MKSLQQKNLLWSGVMVILLVLITSQSGFAQGQLNIFGYFSSRLEKTFSVPYYDEDDMEVGFKSDDFELQFPHFNLILQQSISEKVKIYANLSAGGDNELKNVELANLWGEFSFSNAFKTRLGRTYRKFGLYSEILDASHTYYGAEPPLFFNPDHKWTYLFPRTTNLMIHGTLGETNTFSYGLSFDKFLDESYEEALPMSLDANYKIILNSGHITFGTAYYNSFGEIELGEEEGGEEEDVFAENGTFEWMASDNYSVYGGYLEAQFGDFLFQAGLWQAPHESERDIDEVLEHFADINDPRNLDRFLINPAGARDSANIKTDVDYTIQTWYIRVGYSFYPSIGEIGIYAQWDYYKNPEMTLLKTFDFEHFGVPDKGEYNLITIGMLYRPTPSVAIKLDAANHMYTFLGEDAFYPEFRLDFSFLFGQLL